MATGVTITDDDEHESALDRVRYTHKRTQKGWGYETSVTIHRLAGENGRAWIARSMHALRDARRIAEQERDERDRADGQRGRVDQAVGAGE